MTKKLSVGGQAVIEGVMMKGPEKMAVAVRQANGEIAVDVKPVSSIRDRYLFFEKNRFCEASFLSLNPWLME